MAEYIERGAFDRELRGLVRKYNKDCESERANGAFVALARLRLFPTSDVAPVVHGEWEYYTHTMMACSICKRHVPRHKSEYCPHCGAKMDGGGHGN